MKLLLLVLCPFRVMAMVSTAHRIESGVNQVIVGILSTAAKKGMNKVIAAGYFPPHTASSSSGAYISDSSVGSMQMGLSAAVNVLITLCETYRMLLRI